MIFEELQELHNICPVKNLPSVLRNGILSHDRMKKLKHTSVAMAEIQDWRANVTIPNTNRQLHSYANLYFYARNKMMSKIRGAHRDICVIRIDKRVLEQQDTVVSDQNASSSYVRFGSGKDGLRLINTEMVYARSWKHPEDQRAEWRHGSAICAEVLVPDCVPPRFIRGAYVSCEETAEVVSNDCPDLEIIVNGDLFFL